MKKFLPLVLIIILLLYGMIANYQKKIERMPNFFLKEKQN